MCDRSATEVNFIGSIDAWTQDVDVAFIFVRQHIRELSLYVCRQHCFSGSKRSAVSAVQFHLECGYHTIVARKRRIAERESKCMQRPSLHRNAHLMVRLTSRESKAAVHILQLLRHIEVELESRDVVHVVHAQSHGDDAVCHALGILHMQLVHGKRQSLQLHRVQFVDAVA